MATGADGVRGDADGTLEGCFVFPASFAQERLWFLAQLEPASQVAYHIPLVARLEGSLDMVLLQRAFDETVGRHEALRTRLGWVDGLPVQVVSPALSVAVAVADVGESDDLSRLVQAEARRLFDLEAGPLVRACVFRRHATEHVLVLTVHHVVADGWSAATLVGELTAAYQDLVEGRDPSRPAPELQYADWAVWQRQWLTDERLTDDTGWWRQRLAGVEAAMSELPPDRPRGAVQSFRGGVCERTLPEALTTAVDALAKRVGATRFMALLAGFFALMGRYGDAEDVVVGSPIANRDQPEVDGVVGLFANTVVLRGDLSNDPSLERLLGRVSEVCTSAWAHGGVPFERVVDAVRPARDLSRTPLFQVLFGVEPDRPPTLDVGALRITPLEVDVDAAKFDLSIAVRDVGGAVRVAAEFNSDLYDRQTVDGLLAHYETLLTSWAADPDLPLSSLQLASPEELAQLEVWGAGPSIAVPSATVHQLFEASARSMPKAPAVLAKADSATYDELNRRANRLAHHLLALGVQREDRVAVCLDRSVELLVALLAVLKAGATYVPLDPAYPADRLAFMLEDAAPRTVVTTAELASVLPARAPGLVLVDREAPSIAAAPDHDPATRSRPEDLAYLIYTSGSTGVPKATMVSHGNLANLLGSMAVTPGLDNGDVLVAVTTLSFDIAAAELFLPLVVGGRVVLATVEEGADGEQVAALLARSGATAMQATPVTWRLLLSAGWQAAPGFKALCGGEALAPDLAAQLLAAGAELWNLYGPTETTVWSTAAHVSSARSIALGRPIANTTVRVLDRQGFPTPTGVVGELHIGGAGVARGYAGQPALTADAFVPDPFDDVGGGRLYRTGDLARWTGEGSLVCLGRADDQVKLRGHRIELGEIELALQRHPAIEQAAVVLQHAGTVHARLAAFVVVEGDEPPQAATLRRHLRATLPDHMLPATYSAVPSFPQTPNGKVDRVRLRSTDVGEPARAEVAIAPRSPLEGEIAAMCASVLALESVGVTDDFFELGGHSLVAARLVADIRAAYGVELPLQGLFIEPTVANLAAIVENQIRVGDGRGGGATHVRRSLEALSDADVDALLGDLLATPDGPRAEAGAS
jgi:amino acid adenylation domain-containing protein